LSARDSRTANNITDDQERADALDAFYQ
jgi:hypothetical protein